MAGSQGLQETPASFADGYVVICLQSSKVGLYIPSQAHYTVYEGVPARSLRSHLADSAGGY